ncbi:protein AAR2 homolog isoform X1 [Rhipicephalus microplus]|uniref:protein AAR2 homolog isoform X1 n=1 Tax=Rhipicephalus microplus TaxID=6941 RepID=UPI003F6C48EA
MAEAGEGASNVQVNPAVVDRLLLQGATLVFLDVPPGTEFGLDMSTNVVGDKFRGVKLIPAGLHFVHYSAVSKTGTAAPRTGFFHYFEKGEMLVKKWDKATEDISPEPVDMEEVERLRSNLRGDLDQHLAVFAYAEWRRWISLTKHVSRAVLERLQPERSVIYSATPFEPINFCSHRGGDLASVDSRGDCGEDIRLSDRAKELLELKEVPECKIRYTEIPKKRHPSGSTPSEITKHGMDSSYVLEQLLATWPHQEDLLGELQFVFVCFLVGHVYPCFEQWQKLVRIFCTSSEAIDRHPDFFSDLVSVLHFQLREVPCDFFVDIVSRKNFLTEALTSLFRNIAESSLPDNSPTTLKMKANRFRISLTKLMGWSFEQEVAEEERPVVVELPGGN